MSIKRFSAVTMATVVALSTAVYFVAPTYAEGESSCVTTETVSVPANWSDGETFKLDSDMTGDLALRGSWRNPRSITIDLNGCTLSGRITADDYATITIVDSKGTGVVDGGEHTRTRGAVSAQGSGQIVIEGGDFTETVNYYNGRNYANSNRITVKGGTFLAADKEYVSSRLAEGYGVFTLDDSRVIVEEALSEDDVTFPGDVELTEGDTKSVAVSTDPESKALSVAYEPTSNDYFEIDRDGVLTAKKAGETTLTITVKQGTGEKDPTVATETINVKVNPALKWVRIKDWQNEYDWEPSAISNPTNGHCFGYRTMTAGETFEIETELNGENIDAEIAFEMTDDNGDGAYFDGVEVATIDGNTLTAENAGWARVYVTATYNGTTVTAHGHLYVAPVMHEVVEGDGAEYDGDDLAQEITGEMSKFRYVYIYRQEDLDAFYAEYGEDSSEWDEDAWEAYDALFALVDPENYEVTEGSTIVTYLKEWLETLAIGTYNVEYVFTDGYADATFVIPEAEEEPVVPEDVVTPENVVTIKTNDKKSEVKTAVKKAANTGVATKAVEGTTATVSAALAMATLAGAVVLAKKKSLR